MADFFNAITILSIWKKVCGISLEFISQLYQLLTIGLWFSNFTFLGTKVAQQANATYVAPAYHMGTSSNPGYSTSDPTLC